MRSRDYEGTREDGGGGAAGRAGGAGGLYRVAARGRWRMCARRRVVRVGGQWAERAELGDCAGWRRKEFTARVFAHGG